MAAGIAHGTDPRTPQKRTFTWRPRSFIAFDSYAGQRVLNPRHADYPIGRHEPGPLAGLQTPRASETVALQRDSGRELASIYSGQRV